MAAWENDSPQTLDDIEPTRVVTVRMPKSLHTRLKKESAETGMSINTICLIRLDVPAGDLLKPKSQQAA